MKKTILIATVCMACFICLGLVGLNTNFYVYATDNSSTQETTVEDWFTIENGASVKVNSEKRGIRFATYVNAEKYNQLTAANNSGVEFGTLFMAESDLGSNELTLDTQNVARVTAEKWVDNRESVDENGNYTYMSALVELPEKYYSCNISARSYVTINGETNYTKMVSRSYSGVALAAYANTSASYSDELRTTLYDSYLSGNTYAGLDANSISYNAQKTSLTVIDGGKIKVNEVGKNQASSQVTFKINGTFNQNETYCFALDFKSVVAENCNLYLGVRGSNDEVLTIDDFDENTYKKVLKNGKISFKYTATQNSDFLKFFLFASDITEDSDYSLDYVLNEISARNIVKVNFSLDQSDITLGTCSAGEYADSKVIAATVTEDGVAMDSPAIDWSTSNSNVATVENGTITAVGVGEATITATYVSTDNETFTKTVKVTVVKPILAATLDGNKLDLEADNSDEISLSLAGIDVSADKIQKVFNKTRHNKELSFTVNNGSLVFKKADLKAGINEFRFEFDTIIYDASVEISANEIDVVSFDAEDDISRVVSGDYQLSFSTEYVRPGEIGSLKVTNNSATTADAVLTLKNAINSDMSTYDYVVFYVYNATQGTITAGTRWNGTTSCASGEWTAVKITKSMTGLDGFTFENMNGFTFRILDGSYSQASAIPAGGEIYISALKGVKAEDNICAEFKETTDLNLIVDKGSYTLSINNDEAYIHGEETGSLKVRNASDTAIAEGSQMTLNYTIHADMSSCDYVEFYVYNATASTIRVGTFWCADTDCAPSEWTAVKITRNGLDATYCSFENMNGFKFRFISEFPAGGEIYISALKGVKVEGNVGVDFNDSTDLSRVSSPSGYELSISTEHMHDSESGSLKVKNTSESATGDSYYAVKIIDAYKPDLSTYDYIEFYVYNATESDVTVGVLWYADTLCKKGEWTAIKKIPKTQSLEGCTFSDINGLCIRILSGLPAGGEIYISAITGGYNA